MLGGLGRASLLACAARVSHVYGRECRLAISREGMHEAMCMAGCTRALGGCVCQVLEALRTAACVLPFRGQHRAR